MDQSGMERRVSKRAYFTVEDGVFAVLELPGPDKMSVSTNLLSLSEGGVSFIAHKEIRHIEAGQQLLLVRVFEPESLSFIHQVPIEVRHIINEDDMPHLVCGCQFTDIGDDARLRIREFVATS